MQNRSILRRTALACGIALLAAGSAFADASYPNKPITMVIGYPPGGSTDLVGRMVGTELANRLGQPVVIENLGGAGGAIAAQKVAKSPADGYTIMVGANNELAIARLINKSLKYTIKDFTAIGMVASQPLVLVASQKAGVKNTDEFIAAVAKAPGQTSYGSSGVGTSLHLAGELVKEQGKLQMTHIPYRGVAPLTTDLVGNNIEYGMFVLSSGLPQIQSGKVIALGTTEAKRSAITPNIPALAENPAFKNVDISVWFALMAPPNLPKPIQDKLKKALNDTLASADFRKKLAATGSVVSDAKLDTDKYIASEIAKYTKIVEFAKIEE